MGALPGLACASILNTNSSCPSSVAYPVEASRRKMSTPFSKIIKFAMEKLLGSDVHEISFARLIEALD